MPKSSSTRPDRATARGGAASRAASLDALIRCNPQLSLADILALWHWAGPSARVH